MIESSHLESIVHLLGAMLSQKVREYMAISEIFFTSDKNEGLGAVLNESMNSACAVVANDEIGSVPSLISCGMNGLTYHKGSADELYMKTKMLLDDPKMRNNISQNAYKTIVDVWNADVAANRLMMLCKTLKNHESNYCPDGPCSLA